MKDRFYLACFRDNVGSNVGWHCKGGRGYSTDVAKAQVYTLEEAQKAWEHAREFDQPISADHVDELTVWKVDHQYIPYENTIPDDCGCFVAFKSGQWDGNDVYWGSIFGLSTNFSNAKKLSRSDIEQVPDDYTIIPFTTADQAKRETFEYHLLNNRKMVHGAGLRIPEHIKKHRKRKQSSGKVRWNCPKCGKIVWQYNPYDFEGCNDLLCDGYLPG